MNGNPGHASTAQLEMPGMPSLAAPSAGPDPGGVRLGQQVQYLGNVSGGPRYGSTGVVRQTLSRRVVVDLGRRGTWHIPYYFLSAAA